MILRKLKRLPLNFAEGDPPAAGGGAAGGAETRGACPVCQSELTHSDGIFRGGTPSQQYTDLTRERDRVQELERTIADLRRELAEAAGRPPEPAPAPAPEPARPKAKAKTFL